MQLAYTNELREEQNQALEKATKAWARAEKIRLPTQNLVNTIIPYTGKKYEVKFTMGASCTDGNTIWIQPSMDLGEDIRHGAVEDCLKFDPVTLVKECRACASEDQITYRIVHECAHIVYGSFDFSVDYFKGKDPYLAPMVNALEDARVNANATSDRSGVARLFEAYFRDYIHNGIDLPNGERFHYSNLEDNQQISIAVLIMASKFNHVDLESLSKPNVWKVLNLAEVKSLCSFVASDVDESIEVAKKLLEIFRKHGFFKLEDQPEEPDDPGEDPGGDSGGETGQSEPNPGESGDEDSEQPEPQPGQSGQSEDSDNENPDDDSGGSTSSGESEEPGEGNPGWFTGKASDAADIEEAEKIQKILQIFGGHAPEQEQQDGDRDREAMEKIERCRESTDAPITATTRDVEVFYFDEKCELTESQLDYARNDGFDFAGTGEMSSGYQMPVDAQSATNIGKRASRSALHTFAANRKVAWSTPDKSGHVRRQTGRRLVAGQKNALYRRQRNDKRSYSVIIMLDLSHSTAGPISHSAVYKSIASTILETGFATGEMLSKLGIEFATYAFGNTHFAGGMGNGRTLSLVELKDFDESWNAKAKDRFGRCGAFGTNHDGTLLEWARLKISKRKETDKIILYFSDGEVRERELFEKNVKICAKSPHLSILAVPVTEASDSGRLGY